MENARDYETLPKSEDEAALQMDKKSAQVDEVIQESEELPSIDYSKFQIRQRSSVRSFDVILMHCDIDVERTWVELVVDKLEKKYNLVCGFIGRDFLLDFPIENIFDCIKKHTTVVVTFSEKSERTHPAIRFIEDIEKVVVVMVEDCSLPIVCTNMKCVDATLDEEKWMKQLLITLGYRTEVETYVSKYAALS